MNPPTNYMVLELNGQVATVLSAKDKPGEQFGNNTAVCIAYVKEKGWCVLVMNDDDQQEWVLFNDLPADIHKVVAKVIDDPVLAGSAYEAFKNSKPKEGNPS